MLFISPLLPLFMNTSGSDGKYPRCATVPGRYFFPSSHGRKHTTSLSLSPFFSNLSFSHFYNLSPSLSNLSFSLPSFYNLLPSVCLSLSLSSNLSHSPWESATRSPLYLSLSNLSLSYFSDLYFSLSLSANLSHSLCDFFLSPLFSDLSLLFPFFYLICISLSSNLSHPFRDCLPLSLSLPFFPLTNLSLLVFFSSLLFPSPSLSLHIPSPVSSLLAENE